MFKMTPNVLRYLVSKRPTRRYPKEVRVPFENLRGALVNEIEKCTFCSVCAVKCPSQCIAVDKKAAIWTCDPLACVYCGICVDACPVKCLHQKERIQEPGFRTRNNRYEGRGQVEKGQEIYTLLKTSTLPGQAPNCSNPVDKIIIYISNNYSTYRVCLLWHIVC